jgi:hypothetical protein
MYNQISGSRERKTTMLPFMRAQRRVFAPLLLVLAFAITAGPALAAEGKILPPTARVAGYSLTDAAQKTAYFNTSFDPATGYHYENLYPSGLPFQMLYVRSGNTFEAASGTTLYLPLWFVDDTPTVIGVFPTDYAGALHYAFDRSQLGAHDVTVTIDGQTIPISNAYLAGPITSQLGDGSGTHYITQGVFLKLHKGTHSVVGHAILDGDLLGGWQFISALNYTVIIR